MDSVPRGTDGRRLFTAEFEREQIDRVLRGEVTASELSRRLGFPGSDPALEALGHEGGGDGGWGRTVSLRNGDVVPASELRSVG